MGGYSFVGGATCLAYPDEMQDDFTGVKTQITRAFEVWQDIDDLVLVTHRGCKYRELYSPKRDPSNSDPGQKDLDEAKPRAKEIILNATKRQIQLIGAYARVTTPQNGSKIRFDLKLL
jgi:hypothetical protein